MHIILKFKYVATGIESSVCYTSTAEHNKIMVCEMKKVTSQGIINTFKSLLVAFHTVTCVYFNAEPKETHLAAWRDSRKDNSKMITNCGLVPFQDIRVETAPYSSYKKHDRRLHLHHVGHSDVLFLSTQLTELNGQCKPKYKGMETAVEEPKGAQPQEMHCVFSGYQD